MHRLKELISDLFEIEQDCLHNIEIQDIQFAPLAEQEIDRTVGEMSALTGCSIDIAVQMTDQQNGVRCRGFWIESTRDLVLYLWNSLQSRTILLGRNNWAIRNDITVH
ncbi:MAG: hypothetical protein R6U38_08205 [Desulfatiglandaceae bacterium]